MIKDFRNKEDYFDYRYWKRYAYVKDGIDIPIRVVERKHEIDADTIEPETGKLVSRFILLGDIRRDERVEEIDEMEFYQLCEAHIAAYEKKTAKPEPGKIMSDLDAVNPNDFGEYRYWKRFSSVSGGLDTPIRVLRSKGGNSMDAETIDPGTGQMVSNRMFLIDIRRDERVEEIDEAEFNRLCKAHITAYQEKTAKPEPGGIG